MLITCALLQMKKAPERMPGVGNQEMPAGHANECPARGKLDGLRGARSLPAS
jgi:hypothetical protein